MNEPTIPYKPFMDRPVYTAYHDLLRKIMDKGTDKVPIHAGLKENKDSGHKFVRERTGEVLDFDMENGFPVLPIRDLNKSYKGAIGEVVAFLNGATTLEQLKEYGCPEIFWERWVTKDKTDLLGLAEHSLGAGSYGGSLVHFTTEEGSKEFDQVEAIERQMRKLPFLRTHVLTTWNPALSMGDDAQGFKRKVSVAPCHGNFVHFTLFDNLKELQLTHTQRSADVPVGLVLNLTEWAALGLMMAHLLGYKFTRYTHFISNAHIYDIQFDAVKTLLDREPRRLPTLKIKPDCTAKSLKDFRKTDFELVDYDPHEHMNIVTPV